MRIFTSILFLLIATLAANISPAGADWREDFGNLRIGVIGGRGPQKVIARAEPFRLSIQEALGVSVEIFPMPDYAALIRAQASGGIEYAIYSAMAYAVTHSLCECVTPLVVARSADGETRFRVAIWVAKDSAIDNLAALKGHRVIGHLPDMAGGFHFALHQLRQQKPQAQIPERLIRADTAEAALAAFAGGEADALLGWTSAEAAGEPARGTLRSLRRIHGIAPQSLRLVWRSPPIPHRVHAVLKKLPGDAVKTLREHLTVLSNLDEVAYDAIEPHYGGGFAVSERDWFVPLIDYTAAIRSSKRP